MSIMNVSHLTILFLLTILRDLIFSNQDFCTFNFHSEWNKEFENYYGFNNFREVNFFCNIKFLVEKYFKII